MSKLLQDTSTRGNQSAEQSKEKNREEEDGRNMKKYEDIEEEIGEGVDDTNTKTVN